MAAALRARAPYARQVFLNCPYDDEYRPLLKAVVFAVHACEFTARLALEEPGSERLRLERLVSLIAECGLAIHDLSRVRPTGPDALPRFNMPFECGVFYGALRYGTGRQKAKRFLLLDSEPYRPQRARPRRKTTRPGIRRPKLSRDSRSRLAVVAHPPGWSGQPCLAARPGRKQRCELLSRKNRERSA